MRWKGVELLSHKMHRLRLGKKEKDDGEKESGGGLLSGKSFKKNKNAPAPVAPVIDLTSALPPTDDFRTSLLMPNLAQRFSILAAEQGDSTQSTSNISSNDFGAFNFSSNFHSGGLTDIAETSSMSGSLGSKGGIGTAQSRDSHTSDESAPGAIMNRARPGEGNVLFGGRQKVFRVATNTTRGSSEENREPGSMGGRVYYDNDVPATTFAWREKKKAYDEYDQETEHGVLETQPERSPSPSHPGDTNTNNNRNTSSSTNSPPLTRSSTAATSVNSSNPSTSAHVGSPPNTMVTGKPRRQPLYEQALDQKIQEQSKLELFTTQLRVGAMSPTPINGHSPIDPYQAQRSTSSSPTAERNQFYDNSHNKPTPITAPVGGLSTFNFGLDTKSGDDTNGTSERVGGYDDERYHLMQRHKLRDDSPTRLVDPPMQRPESPAQESIKEPEPLHDTRASVSSAESNGQGGLDWSKLDLGPRNGPGKEPQFMDKRQSEAQSHQTFLSTPSSNESSEYEYDVRGDSFDQMRAGESGIGLGLQESEERKTIPPLNSHRNDSSSESDRQSVASTVEQSIMKNNALLQSDEQPSLLNGNRPLSPISPHLMAKDGDSPTLPPVQGLSVLVRQHLRKDSSRSSIYTTRSRISRQVLPEQASNFGFAGKSANGTDPVQPSGASGSSGGNLWEFDDWDGGYYGEDPDGPESPTSMTHPAFRKRSVASMESTETREETTEDRNSDLGRNDKQEDDWHQGREQISDRSGNQTSDEDEDRDWEDELAHRKKLVQQNLREHESRSNSPVPEFARDSRPNSPGPLNLLKKTSNGMLNGESGSKAMRMLGMGGDKHRDLKEEEERLRETVRGAKNLQMHQGPGHYVPHPQDREFQSGPPLGRVHPSQRRPPQMGPNMANRPPPPHLDDHPAMRNRPPPNFQGRGPPHGPPPHGEPHGPPYGPPYGPPVSGRSPMRGPSLRSQPSRERLRGQPSREGLRGQASREGFRDREGENSPRMMSPPRSGDPRWRDDRQFDGYQGISRSPMSHSPNPNMPGAQRMVGTPRMDWDGPTERRPGGAPMSPPSGRPMGRGPQGGYPEDPRMLKRGPSNRMGPPQNDMRDRGRDEMGNRRQGPYFPEQSPPPQMRPRGYSNAQSPPYNSPSLTRQRSESAIRRGGPTLPPLQTSPQRSSPALNVNGGLDQSPQVGKTPGGFSAVSPPPPPPSANPGGISAVSPPSANSSVPPSASTPLSPVVSPVAKSIGFPSTPSVATNSPALPSTPASAGPAAAAYAKMQSFQQSSGPAAKKRVVDKSKISEPKLIASTSNISTVPLPPQSPTPPLTALGGSLGQRKRRQTTTIFGGFGKNNSAEKMPSDGELEKSSFQMDEPKKEKGRGKLRKSTSDGGGLSARARREADKNAPATPQIPQAARAGMI